MDSLIQFVQENAVLLGIIAIAVIPLGYVYRQYTFPLLFHSCEGLIYASIWHAVLWSMVSLATWFKNASSMEALDDVTRADWSIPLMAPWDRAAYDPSWVFFLEVAGWVAILYIIIFIRPVGTKNRYKREAKPGKIVKTKQSARAAYRAKIEQQKAGRGTVRK